jgi:hypothetical protein
VGAEQLRQRHAVAEQPACSMNLQHTGVLCVRLPAVLEWCHQSQIMAAPQTETPCATCRMLYRATPAWDEPTEVREMLDASDELDAIPEDAVRTPCSH